MKFALAFAIKSIAVLGAVAAVLFAIAVPLESVFSWNQDMEKLRNSARCDAKSAASGARGPEFEKVKAACMDRLASSK